MFDLQVLSNEECSEFLSVIEEDVRGGRMTAKSFLIFGKHGFCPFVTKGEAANLLGVTKQVLTNYQATGGGPVARKHSGHLMYSVVDILAFSEMRIVAGR